MNKILIVIEREFTTRIRKKSFILLTLLMPLLMIAVVTVPVLLASMDSDKKINVALIDQTGKYAPLLKDTNNIYFTQLAQMHDSLKKESSDFTAVVLIRKDLTTDSLGATIYSHKEVPVELSRYFNDVVSEQIKEEKLSAYNISNINQIIEDSKAKFSVRTVKWAEDGSENESSATIAGVVGMMFTLLIYMFVLSYGGMVMQGVMEEKTNRIMEIMVSSVKPFQLMMGKIIGIALVGLLQFAIWGGMIIACIGVLSMVAKGEMDADTASAIASNMQNMNNMPPVEETPANEILNVINGLNIGEILTMFMLYFVGGYLLYASFFAAVGASINEPNDSSQFMMPVVILMIFSLYAGMFSIENPDGPLALWCSFIPLTSPIVMMVRLPFGVPVWQLAVSIALLFATAIAVVWLSAKIYRVGILMYGKKPTFKEMARWITFK